MYKSVTIFISLFALIFVVQGCNDLLDNPAPSNELSEEVVLNNESTVDGVRIKLYDRLHSFEFTTQYMLGPSALADGFVQRRGTGRFGPFIRNELGQGLAEYATVYKMVNNANIIINGISEGVLSEAKLDRYKGEAYFFRAFAFFYEAKALGYEPGITPNSGPGEGFNLSIILSTEPTTSVVEALKLKTRSTSSEVYDQIESDLRESIDLLSNNSAVQNATINYVKAAAAEALLSRVNLYRRDYEEADKFAQDALQKTSARLATKSEVPTMFDETTGINPEAIFLLDVDPLQEGLGIRSVSSYTATYWNAMIPSQVVLNLYSKNDVRRKAWYGPCYSDNAGNCEDTAPTGIEFQKWNGELGQQTDDIPYFRVSELLLIQTEARINNSSLGDPLAPINKLRSERGIPPLADVTIEDVLDERLRELIGEGHRFWDLKRLGRDIRKANGPAIPFNDPRVLDNIPDSEIEINPELTQNPGY